MTPSSIAVVIPTRNRHGFLREAVTSVIAQHRPAAEIIVVDDGEGAGKALSTVEGPLRVLDNGARGPVPARILGVEAARSDIIVFLDDDDRLIDAGWLDQVAVAIEAGADFCHGGGIMVFEDGSPDLPWDYGADQHTLERDNTILISAVGYRRELHARLGRFDEKLPYYWDWDWYLRIARSGARLAHIPAPVVAIRVHAGNMSGVETEAERRANLDRFAQKHGLPPLVLKNHLVIARDGLG